KILLTVQGEDKEIPLTENDLVCVKNVSITESTARGDPRPPAPVTDEIGGSWRLWKNLADQSDEFGHPEVFYKDLPKESWFVSATATWENNDIEPYIEKLTQRDVHSGKVVTGGIVTIKESNWMMSFAVHRQPHFKVQKDNQTVMWIYGLYSNVEGNYVKKSITECSGEEIAQEFLYHLGVPESKIKEMAKSSCNVIPTYMPFITSYFMVRKAGDRPLVVPPKSKNLAFIGNFTETERDTVFTTEYSVRTAMEAVYQLLGVERGVPEVFASAYDIRELLQAVYYLGDKKSLHESKFALPTLLERLGMKKIKGTWIEELLEESKLILRNSIKRLSIK